MRIGAENLNKGKVTITKVGVVTSRGREEVLLREGTWWGVGSRASSVLFFDLGGGHTDVSFIILLNCPNMFYTVFCI